MSDTTGQARKRKSQRRFEQINHLTDSVIQRLPTVSQRLLLLVCWRHAKPNGECRISTTQLSKATGICVRQVVRAIDGMVAAGALQVVKERKGTIPTTYKITGGCRS